MSSLNAEKFNRFCDQLNPFLPEQAITYVAQFIMENNVRFTVAKKRKTKLGDYRQPFKGKSHQISVNGDLNQYAFLVTTIHEFAHLVTFEKYGNGVRSHGVEWKHEFKELFAPLIKKGFLPEDVKLAVSNYLKNAKASSCTDEPLYRVLRRYNIEQGVLVEHLKKGAIFELKGKRFELGKKLRKRYECVDLDTGRLYRVLGLAEVDKVLENI